jgi:hypothetical protein
MLRFGEHMNASRIDCFASPVSSFSATAISARMTSPDLLNCHAGWMPRWPRPGKSGPSKARSRAEQHAARRRKMLPAGNVATSEPIIGHTLTSNEGLRLGANGPVMRWGVSS